MSQSRAQIRKLPVHNHMTHMVEIDNLTGHEERLFSIAYLSKNHAFS